MAKLKVSGLEGAQLDYWVTKAVGKNVSDVEFVECYDVNDPDNEYLCPKGWVEDDEGGFQMDDYSPSTNWQQGGPLIEEHGILVQPISVQLSSPMTVTKWGAFVKFFGSEVDEYEGSTPLIAAMRCIVSSKYGDEVEAHG